jgi:hypothetical protein
MEVLENQRLYLVEHWNYACVTLRFSIWRHSSFMMCQASKQDFRGSTMVKVGDFTVELVAADTKQPFKEHTASDGQVYAEVEPDVDYFLSLGSDIGRVITNIWVDGVNLGYRTNFHKPCRSEKYRGKWERRRDGKETMTALRFNKTREVRGTVAPDMLTGKVEVAFYEFGTMYYKEWLGGDTADSTLGGKKCIKSTTNGSYSFDKTPKGRTATSKIVKEYTTGKHIRTVKLNYCSALGLIYHKILPPPPDLDDDSAHIKHEKPRKRKRSTETSVLKTARVSPQEKINAAVKTENIEAQTVTVQQTYALVDLTASDGDED